MPRIPTYTASEKLYTGSTGPHARPEAFNPTFGLEDVGESLLTAGNQLSHIAQRNRTLEEKKKRDDEARWISDKLTEFTIKAADFERANENDESFGPITLDGLTKLAKAYQPDAPSSRAGNRLQSLLNQQIATRYERNASIGERTKLKNAFTGVGENVQGAMAAFRADASSSPAYAAGNLEQLREQMHQSITERWDGMAPETAAKMHTHVDDELVIGTASANPDYARALLNGSQHIDEARRATLLGHIERAEQDNQGLNQTIAQQDLDDALSVGLETGTPIVFGKHAFTAWDDGDAKKIEFEYKQKAIAINKAIAITGRLKDKSAPYIGKELAALREQVKGESDHNALNHARQFASKAMELQDKDPAGFLQSNNSEVSTAFKRALEAPEAEGELRRMGAYETLLKYQGAPPEGLPPAEAGRYLGLPAGAQRLLSRPEAEAYVQQIKKGAPADQVATLTQLEKQFGKYWPQAYSDLVNLPEGKGIPQEMRLALLIQDPAVQNEYIGAITKTEAIRSLADETKAKFRTALQSNPTWRLFQQPIIGDNFQRADELAGYQNGLLAYAYARHAHKGESPQEAVKKSVDTIIDTHFGFADVRGQVIAIPRWRSDKSAPWRDDATVRDLGRRLTLALREVPIEEMQLTDAYGRNIFASAMTAPEGKERNQHIQDVITTNGFWVSDPDGQSVTLYLKSDVSAGQPVDKRGQPFRVVLDQLPAFQRSDVKMYDWRVGTTRTNTSNVKPSGTYPLNAQPNRDIFQNLRKASRITTLQHQPAILE